MPTFTPPTVAGRPVGDPDDPSWAMFRHFDSWATGQTVWKDSEGVWHRSIEPYMGGAIYVTHDAVDGTTVSGPDEGLATAEVVYLGGHEHPISDLQAIELVLAGFTISGHSEAEEQKWVDYAIASDPNLDWKGGDGCASQELGTGESIWTFADNNIGTLDADGYQATVGVSRNAVVVQDATGAITGQILPGGTQPAFPHPTPTHWWWPLDITLDGTGTAITDAVVAALHLGPGAGFGEFLGNDLLLLNLFGGVDSSVAVTLWGTDWQINTVYNDAAFHYITGNGGGDSTTLQSYTVMARAPLGSLTNPAAWENWNGTGWSTGRPDFLRDLNGLAIEGGTTITKAGDDWILAVMSLRDPQVRLFKATAPQGPYRPYWTGGGVSHPQGRAGDGKTSGALPNGGWYAYYQPKFHEQLAPSERNLVLSYNRNVFPDGFPSVLEHQPNDYHVSTFCPQFVYLPTPEGI